MTVKKSKQTRSGWASRPGLAVLIGAAIGSFILFPELRVRIWEALPWLFLLLCPLMHVFMHRGHGGHDVPPFTENREADHD